MRITLAAFAFAAPVRMVDRIHDDTAYMGTAAEPSGASRLPDIDVLMIKIADLADGRCARRQNPPHFTRLEPHLHIPSVPAHDLCESSRAADQLTASSWLEFDVVNRRPQGHVGERQRIACPHFRIRTRLNDVPDLQTDRRKNVPLLSVLVRHEGDASRTVGIVLERRYLARNAKLVPPEVNLAVKPAMPGSTKADRGPSVVIPAAGPQVKGRQRFFRSLLRQLLRRDDRHSTAARRRWLIRFQSHGRVFLVSRALGANTYALSYSSSFSPSLSLTKAFFQSDRFPENRPKRLILPCTLRTLTRSTLTFNSVSTACLICTRLASG